jgi:MATE family multidrug resistance protein
MKNCDIFAVEQVTQYNAMSVIKFTLSMVLSSLSVNITFVLDRAVLAHYSIDSMTAATIASSFVVIPIIFATSITGIAAVFVGQLNGSGRFKNIAEPVWQMIYFGVLISILFIILSLFIEDFTSLPPCYRSEGVIYQKIIMAFAGVPAISSAVSSFFIGTYSGFIVILTTVICNVLNFVLDIFLVFGMNGIMPELGIKGAAIATVIAQCTQFVILFSLFIRKSNRDAYCTANYGFQKQLFIKCFKVGLPLSIAKIMEMSAWYFMFLFLSYTSKDFAVIESVAISITSLFMFFADGMNDASSSLHANLIGQNNRDSVKYLFRLLLLLNIVFCIFFAIPLILKQNTMGYIMKCVNGDIWRLYNDFLFVFKSIWIGVFLDGIAGIMIGALRSGGDTKFPIYLNISTVWAFVVFPVFAMYHTGSLTSIKVVFMLIPLQSFVAVLIIYNRYKKNDWFMRLIPANNDKR